MEGKHTKNSHFGWLRFVQQQDKNSLAGPGQHIGSDGISTEGDTAIDPMQDVSAMDVVEFLERKPVELIIDIFVKLPLKKQIEVFDLLKDNDLKLFIYSSIAKKNFVKIFVGLSPSVRWIFYHLLNHKERVYLLPYLGRGDRERIIEQSAYLPDSAGSLMRTNIAIALYSMTIGQVIDKMRSEVSATKMFYFIYIVDEHMKLLGCVSLKDLIIHNVQDSISKILKKDLILSTIDDSKEEAAKKIERYNLIALPIVNDKQQIVGIITYDDAMSIIREEQGEDTNLMMGIDAEESDLPYLATSSTKHLSKRIKWIVIVFMTSIIGQTFFHAKNAFFLYHSLFLYLGMITDTGGNVGNQAASVVLQALNRGQVALSDWFKILLKEIEISLMLALVIFGLTFVKIYLITSLEPDTTRNFDVMCIVAFSVALQIICSAFIGAALPLAAKYFKGDPAVASNPVINTTVELLGLFIYYAVIYWFLNPVDASSSVDVIT